MLRLPLAILWTLILCCAALAQERKVVRWDNGVTEQWWVDLDTFSQQELDRAIGRWKRIEIDNSPAESHAWAGGYFTGSDTHGTYMRWSRQSGFIMAHVDKCAAQLMGLSLGTVTVSPTSIKFTIEYQKASGSHGHAKAHRAAVTPIKYVPVRWSYDQYLVAENEMSAFGNFVAGLGKYNQQFGGEAGMEFFARNTSQAKSNYGEPPQVPRGYEQFIKKPVNAEITAVGTPTVERHRGDDGSWEYERHTPVTVNVGSRNGARQGMVLRILSSDEGESVRIIRVGRSSSQGLIVRWLDNMDEEHEKYMKALVGTRLSTSMHGNNSSTTP